MLPLSAFSKFSAELKPSTLAGVSMCDKSAATPGVWTISYKLKWDTNGLCFNNRLNG